MGHRLRADEAPGSGHDGAPHDASDAISFPIRRGRQNGASVLESKRFVRCVRRASFPCYFPGRYCRERGLILETLAPGHILFAVLACFAAGSASALTFQDRTCDNDKPTCPLPAGNAEVPYQFDMYARSGCPPYHYDIDGGTPPPGLTLSTVNDASERRHRPSAWNADDSRAATRSGSSCTRRSRRPASVTEPIGYSRSRLVPAPLGDQDVVAQARRRRRHVHRDAHRLRWRQPDVVGHGPARRPCGQRQHDHRHADDRRQLPGHGLRQQRHLDEVGSVHPADHRSAEGDRACLASGRGREALHRDLPGVRRSRDLLLGGDRGSRRPDVRRCDSRPEWDPVGARPLHRQGHRDRRCSRPDTGSAGQGQRRRACRHHDEEAQGGDRRQEVPAQAEDDRAVSSNSSGAASASCLRA